MITVVYVAVIDDRKHLENRMKFMLPSDSNADMKMQNLRKLQPDQALDHIYMKK